MEALRSALSGRQRDRPDGATESYRGSPGIPLSNDFTEGPIRSLPLCSRANVCKVNEEGDKPLHAYYAGAVPVDLLRSEQDRLASETRQAEHRLKTVETSFGDIADTLTKALNLLADCRFERLVAYDERIADAEVVEPFAILTDPELPKRLNGEAVTGTKPFLLAAVQMRSF